MERRELLKMITVLTGAVLIGGDALLLGCRPGNNNADGTVPFTKEDQALLDEVAETILPETKTPGAKAAKVGAFMVLMVNDCYDAADQQAFYTGIRKLDEAAEKMHGTGFMDLAPLQRNALLVVLDKEAKDDQAGKAAREEAERKKNKDFAGLPNHYFIMMKQLTLLGYFSSEAGCTQALRYIAVPGHYDGTVPYKKGDRAWA